MCFGGRGMGHTFYSFLCCGVRFYTVYIREKGRRFRNSDLYGKEMKSGASLSISIEIYFIYYFNRDL